jgi:hypothetical protein
MSDIKQQNLFQQLRNPEELAKEGWYDWFCKTESLPRRGKSLVTKVRKIAFSQRFDGEKVYVWFKNNCPVGGTLYDDFRIADIETGDTLYVIIPSSGFRSDNGSTQLFGRENDFICPLVEGTMKDIYAFFDGDDSKRVDSKEESNAA